MIKNPENYGLIQIVLESIKLDEKLIHGIVSGNEIELSISKALLYILYMIVFVSLVRAITFVVDVFGKLGVSIVKLGVDVSNIDKKSAALGGNEPITAKFNISPKN